MRSALLAGLVCCACSGSAGGGVVDYDAAPPVDAIAPVDAMGPVDAIAPRDAPAGIDAYAPPPRWDAWSPGMDMCSGVTVDLGTDVHNCGWCGHDCAGSGCAGGLCDPVIVATSGSYSYRMVSDDSSLYWTIATKMVVTVPKTGGFPTVLASGFENYDAPLAIDDTNVYWADTHAIMKVPKTGGTPQQLATVATGNSTQLGFALDQDYVYWFEGTWTTAQLFRVSKLGGAAELVSGFPTCPNGATQSAAMINHAGTLYFEACWNPANLQSVPATGGTSTELADNFFAAMALVADDEFVYWPELGTNIPGTSHIWKLPLAGGAKTAVVPATPLYDLQLYAGDLYWVDWTGILAVPKTGGPTRTYAAAGANITQLAVDAQWVYFMDEGRINIYKVAR